MEYSPNNRSHTFFFIVTLTLCAIALTLFSGALYFIYSKKPSLSRLSAEHSGIADEEAYYRGLKKTLSDTNAGQDALDSYFIDPENFVPFVEKIEALGADAGVMLTIESAGLTDANRTLALVLSADGAFGNVLHFLSLVEAYPAKVVISRAWLSKTIPVRGQPPPSKPWNGKFDVKFASN